MKAIDNCFPGKLVVISKTKFLKYYLIKAIEENESEFRNLFGCENREENDFKYVASEIIKKLKKGRV